MELMSCIVSADEDEYPEIAASPSPLKEWSGIEVPGLDTVKLATLHSLVTGDSLQAALDYYEPIYVEEGDSETIILRIDGEFFDALVALDEDDVENLVGELAATEAYENESYDVDDIYAYVVSLIDLAQLAESQAQLLFVWIRVVEN
ncbi:hypothetical protein [Rhodocyclus tenuis]|uniref:Uncharacterized protein n=1 Tax=Rhodocyclus tenuis TaxID=1066 RepID=A0A840G7X7_RHOTE|nr:hypothetical protein [Rhodocyclus tenuis]MBB4247050.1 hypothetical protein [Rhodocyclus tenuis]